MKDGEEAYEELKEAMNAGAKAHDPSDDSSVSEHRHSYAHDDVTGEPLEVKRVVQARREEIAYFKKMM
eukprot:11348702-Karenia_brevis.AAC.1